MSAELVQIKDLEKKQPVFKEFCNAFGLKNGDYYKATDYLSWTQNLSYSDIVRILKRSEQNARY